MIIEIIEKAQGQNRANVAVTRIRMLTQLSTPGATEHHLPLTLTVA